MGRWIDADKLHYNGVMITDKQGNTRRDVVVFGKEIDRLANRTNISDVHDDTLKGASDLALQIVDDLKRSSDAMMTKCDAIQIVLNALECYEHKLTGKPLDGCDNEDYDNR